MSKFCPNCGAEINSDKCPNCGHVQDVVGDTGNVMVSQGSKSRSNKGIIIGLLVVVFVVIVGLVGFAALGSDNSGKVLCVGDLELNMTGYDYKLDSNTSVDNSGVSGYTETYSVNGQGDNFKLTVSVIDDNLGIGNVGDLGTVLSGDLNAVAVTKYINGKYYWIQISFANDNHNTKEYLESIIITQSDQVPDNNTQTVSSASSSNSGSSHSSDNDEYYTGPSGDGSIITTRNGPTEGGGYNYHGVHYDSNGIADGPAY